MLQNSNAKFFNLTEKIQYKTIPMHLYFFCILKNAPRKRELKIKKKILRKKAVARYKKSITVPDADIMPKTILKKRQ